MKSSLLYLFVVSCVYQTSSVLGFGTGAPPAACVTMTPGHLDGDGILIPPQITPSPYSLTVDKNRVQRGQKVQVTINGGTFKGCLLQARSGSGLAPVGTFSESTPAETKTTTCTAERDSVTHSSTTDKPDGTTFTWEAPDEEFDDIVFMATVAQLKTTFWVGILSEPVTASAPWILSSVSLLLSSVVATLVLSQ